MSDSKLQENLVMSWIDVTGMLKNSRITKKFSYNEAIIMLFTYNKYREDGDGISFKQLVLSTKMMKSLVNRTVNSLKDKGLVTVVTDETDKRSCKICIVEDQINVFLAVYSISLEIAQKVINIIGEDDTKTFLRIVQKLDRAQLKL